MFSLNFPRLITSNFIEYRYVESMPRTSLLAQKVRHLPTMWETWVQSLGWEDLLEEGMATHSSILAWRISWTEEPDGLQSIGSQKLGHDWATSLSLSEHAKGNQISLPICRRQDPQNAFLKNNQTYKLLTYLFFQINVLELRVFLCVNTL